MRLKLSEQKKISILHVSEELNERTVLVMKAGIAKLLKAGKNRLIIDLGALKRADFGTMSPEVVFKELGLLNTLSQDLSGEIVLAGLQPDLLQSVTFQLQALGLHHYLSIDDALKAFEAVSQDAFEIQGNLEDIRAENKRLKEKILSFEKGEAAKLRSELEQVRKENQQWSTHLQAWAVVQRQPKELELALVRIKELESKLADAYQAAKAPAAPAAAPAPAAKK